MKYSILLLVLFLSSCNSNNKQSTIDKSENKIYKKDTLAELIFLLRLYPSMIYGVIKNKTKESFLMEKKVNYKIQQKQ